MALTQVDQGLLGTYAQYTGFKNRIINGDMRIDQRNAGASVTVSAATGVYTLDRYFVNNDADSVLAVVQDTSAPAGFKNSLKVTVSTADAAIGATQNVYVGQNIEGYNVADMGFGAAGASTFTVSFWVKSSLTGTFGGVFGNSALDRSYPFTYTISAANTWEWKTVTVAGDVTGTWLTTNGIGLRVWFAMGTGSTYLGTANAWAGAQYRGATGQTQVISTLNATWQVSGVQLEKGSTATSFDYRPYGTELALCQRYYWKWTGTEQYMVSTFIDGAQKYNFFVALPVIMRANPTLTSSTMAYRNGSTYSDGSVVGTGNYTNGSYVQYYGPSAPNTWGTSLPCYITTGWSWSAEL